MAHSMKGGARVCDLEVVERLTHDLEQVFSELGKKGEVPDEGQRRRIERVMAAVEDYMAVLAGGGQPEVPVEAFAELGLRVPSRVQREMEEMPVPAVKPEGKVGKVAKQDTLRVSATHLDRLLQSSSQVLAQSMQQHGVGVELQEVAAVLDDLQRQCDVVRSRGEEALSPKVSGPGTLQELQRGMAKLSRVVRGLRTQQQQSARALRVLSGRLQQDVRDARMVPAGSVFEGFPKMVRDMAGDEGKEVEFVVSGMEREVDRLVLQGLKDAVMHTLRNAVTHGIESRVARESAGKNPVGRIGLELEVTGNRVVLKVWDDGRGLNVDFIRRRSLEAGLVSEDEARAMSAEEVRAMVFQPGFSTRKRATSSAGRGMGMSVVREAVVRLQGQVAVRPGVPSGTVVEMVAPLSAATHRLLLVKAAGQVFAIPSGAIQRLLRVKQELVETVDGKAAVWMDGQAVLLAGLADVLGVGKAELVVEAGGVRVVVMSILGRRLAVAVDGWVKEMDALLLPLPYPASASPFFSGGVVMEDGSVTLVVQAAELMERFKGKGLSYREEDVAALMEEARRPVILVVDDSFTARTLQKNILETEGYEVRLAVDGVQALAALRTGRFDAVVSDIQMPHMDGFELLESMKRDARLKEVPVVLVTSLNSEEDQMRGLSLGADAYLVKQKFDHKDLLGVIRQLV